MKKNLQNINRVTDVELMAIRGRRGEIHWNTGKALR